MSMWERGFKFGKLDLYRSKATEFLIDGDTLIPPFVAMDGLGENVAKQLIRAREEGESSLKQSCASVVGSHQPWLKRWMKWGFLEICQRITS